MFSEFVVFQWGLMSVVNKRQGPSARKNPIIFSAPFFRTLSLGNPFLPASLCIPQENKNFNYYKYP